MVCTVYTWRRADNKAMSSTNDHLGILGLSQTATKAEIKKAYHKVCH